MEIHTFNKAGVPTERFICYLWTKPEDATLSGFAGPGWYFFDEAHTLHGPFETRKEAVILLRGYCESL